ncbi:MAG TPA: peptidylprolyl isomerase, partial [Ignavibacteriales bacterium]|nr:peptidylprolyl isomerase [Ignavibacteriales bacterium]
MKRYIFLLIFAFAGSLFAQEVVDKIAAVVGNEIILQSELDFQTSMAAAQNRTTPTPAMKTQVLNAIIQEKLLYQQALLDSVVVTDDEVDRQLDYQIQMFVQQYGSKERVEEAYGMSLEKIKRELRDDLRKNLMSQRVQEKRFGMVEATKRETEMFFEEYKDSLGLIPEKYDLARIFVNPRASDKVKEKFRSFAKSLIDSIKSGADFAQLAKKYSEDPGSAAGGGDLGFVKKGVFFSEFEAASFALNPGEISDVV